MKAENFTCNRCSHRQIVKGVRKVFPHIGIAVFSKTLVIETVATRDVTHEEWIDCEGTSIDVETSRKV